MKAYALGLFSAALALLLVTAIWIGTQPNQEPGLLWGDTVYSSKQEFDGYLKSKGLSYKTWLARNPGAAPWEPEVINVGAITVRVPTKGDSVVRLLLAAIGLMLAIGFALLLLGRENPVLVRFAGGSVVFFSVFSAVVLVAIWFGGQPKQEPALSWGGAVYTSKQEFNGYLKSKGLSYKTWLARNPGAAPWEPAAVRVSIKAPEATKVREVTKAPEATKGGEGWVGRPLLAALGLMLAAVCALLLLRRERPVMARFANGSVAFFSPGTVRLGKSPAGMPSVSKPIKRLGVVASGAADRLKVSVPLYGARLLRAARPLARRLIRGAREIVRLLAQVMRERDITFGKVALGLLAVVGAIMVALTVVFLSSSL